MSQLLILTEATGLSIIEVCRLPSFVANLIIRSGGVQEGRYRETRLLLASATAIHAEKLRVNDLLKDSEKLRFPNRLTKDRHIADQNRERALEALRARQGR